MSVRVLYIYLFAFLILLLSCRIFPQINSNQISSPVLENISIKDGLPENSVTCILQDYLGYLWLGTQNGLVRYDGYTMKVFQPEENDSLSISGRGISIIFEDEDNIIWIGTLDGLDRFDRAKETFKSYKFSVDDSNTVSSNKIFSIYLDPAGRFWIGTDEGLNLFDRKEESFTRYYFRYNDTKVYNTSVSEPENLCVKGITEDPLSGNILIGTTEDGLWEFNIRNMTFSKYRFNNESDPDTKLGSIQSFFKSRDGRIWMLSQNTLCSLDPYEKEFDSYIDFPIRQEERFGKGVMPMGGIVEDNNGFIWCGFYSGAQGLFCLDPVMKKFHKYNIDPDTSENSYGNHLFCVYIDRSDILWAGSWGLGLYKWDKRKYKFFNSFSDSLGLENLAYTYAASMAYDHRGYVWLTSHRGLEKYDIKKERFYYYLQNEKCITQNNVYSTLLDKDGNVWIGTSCGLIKFNPSDNTSHYYFNDLKEPVNLVDNIIFSMYQDHLGIIWIGTDGSGYYRYDTAKNKLTRYKHNNADNRSISDDNARTIYEDRSGTLWFGTNFGGLNKFDRNTETFEYCGFNCVQSIYEDKTGNFWVSDFYSGLNLFDRKTKKVIKNFGRKDGLLSYSFFGILEDDHNNLWIKTDNGLFKFNTETRSIKRYTTKDGLDSDFFLPYPSSHCMGPGGTMLLMGGKFQIGKSITIFHPDSIKDDMAAPNVLITSVSSFNHPDVKLSSNGFIPDLKEITLPYTENDLRIEYAGLQYSEPLGNQYKYYLENFDNDWISSGNIRQAVYTNLEPGEYIFKVMAANRDGIWNEIPASIKIIITPPWWRTNLAYFIFTLVLISIVYYTWKLQLKRIRIKQENEMNRFEAEKLHEVDELKSQFFTNISHEFRTPLTLILEPVKQIIEKANDGKIKEELRIVYKNANKLLSLVTQLLDISKIESGNMRLQAAVQNVTLLIKGLTLSFTSYAERKNIILTFCSKSEIRAYVDKEKIENIVNNVLSNAFKFTPEGGRIEVAIMEDNDNFMIKVSDTGLGIPGGKLSRIFDRFYQVDGSCKREQEGTGIGLALTKELVELHKGKIEVQSTEGKGTIFKIFIPVGKEYLNRDEILWDEKGEIISGLIPETAEDLISYKPKFDVELMAKDNLPILLIVEDNHDVRNYIKNNLKGCYKIIEAIDGEDGLNKSLSQIPEIIISDVMMPKMDGLELCGKLKTDERTSHIPVILLTAKAARQDKLNGLDIGADDYIMKPFDTVELKARIKNLLDQRRRIHDHFRKNGLIEIEGSEITPLDQRFLQKIAGLINENISDASFNVEKLAHDLGMSRSVLYRKMVSLTGEPAVELIKRIRLTKASELLRRKTGNISVIALEVGFNNPAYFSRCFKEEFGSSPLQYSQRFSKS